MKISIWVTISDLIPTRQTLFEKTINLFDKKRTLFHSHPHNLIFKLLKNSGIEGIELLIPFYTTNENIQEVKKIITSNDIPIFSIHQSLAHKTDISLDEITKLCKIANIFFASIVVLHSDTLRRKLLDINYINQLKKLEKQYQITFGIENMEKSLLPIESFTYNDKSFSSVINKAGLSMTFDTTHLAQTDGNIINFYIANRERIVNIHLSDYKKTWINRNILPQLTTHLTLGEGELPIDEFLKTLRMKSYKGLITLEINAGLKELCKSARVVKSYIS